MKYKVEDEVKIKTWKEMKAEFGCQPGEDRVLKVSKTFITDMEKSLNSDRILIIRKVKEDFYEMENVRWSWTDDMIEGLAKDIKTIEPIDNRFEILDI